MTNTASNPQWWKDEHTSTWDRLKTALRRDWEQTKADLSSSGKELNQGVTDTVKQAAGTQPTPGPNTPNPEHEWKKVEGQYRYGVGARAQYSHEFTDWDDSLESKLSKEWDELRTGHAWNEARSSVKRGWETNA